MQDCRTLEVDQNGTTIFPPKRPSARGSSIRTIPLKSSPSSMLMRTVESGLRATRATFLRFSNERVRDLLLQRVHHAVSFRLPVSCHSLPLQLLVLPRYPPLERHPRAEEKLSSLFFRQLSEPQTRYSLDQIKDGHPISYWTNDRISIWSEENVPLAIDCPAQVAEAVV